MTYYILVAISVILNFLLMWYTTRLLKKFYFISENLADLYLTLRSFQIFTTTMYSMDTYHGEPMIQELVYRIKEANVEMEEFREIFEFSLDEELEEELNATEEET
jgi:DNA mismatch repair ATPase MutS